MNAQEHEYFRGFKLLLHSVKIWERIMDARLKREVKMSRGQFGFMPGKEPSAHIEADDEVQKVPKRTSKDIYIFGGGL